MIRRISSWTPQEIAVCTRDLFGTRTLGYLKTYGTETNAVGFYAQYVHAQCVGVLSDAFGHGALTTTSGADMEEWKEFAAFLGLQSLLCAAKDARAMDFSTADCGHILRYFGSEQITQTPFITPQHAAFSYREVYDLLCMCGFSLGEYAAWFGDFALRVRRNAARVLCVRASTTVATASVLFESDDAVYLGAVATHPDYRGRGFGGNLVQTLAQCGKRAEIMCKPHRVSFYEKLGFRQNGEFVLCPFSK